MVNYPLSLLIKVISEQVDIKGLLCALKTCFNIVTIAQQYALELILIIDAKKAFEFLASLDRSLSEDLFVLSQDRSEFFVVACISCREGNALALVLAHVERVIPVGASELHVTVLTDVEESREILKEEVLHDRAAAGYAGKIGILVQQFLASHNLAVDEVGSRLVQDLEVTCLLYIKIHGHERPHCVVHPDTCDAVSVSDEFAALAADNGCVCAVAPYAAEVIDEHASYV